MHIAEIIILIAGAVLFTVSFIMPDKGDNELDKEEERKLIRELLDEEVGNARNQIEDATEECVNDNRDRMERALDRITNEKMNAVNDYSNTVLDQIHKNHEEVMFLYDMLNNKHTQIKNTAAELNQITKSARAVADNLGQTSTPAEEVVIKEEINPTKTQSQTVAKAAANTATGSSATTVQANNVPVFTKPENVRKNSSPDEKGFGYVNPGKRNAEGEGFGFTKPAAKQEKTEVFDSIFEEIPKQELDVVEMDATEAKPAAKKKTAKAKVEKIPVIDSGIDLMFASDNNSANNNDKILALHKEGKSNMAIAKELGLGIGEVKLVIDLFEGI